jgi:hypothetical protein
MVVDSLLAGGMRRFSAGGRSHRHPAQVFGVKEAAPYLFVRNKGSSILERMKGGLLDDGSLLVIGVDRLPDLGVWREPGDGI